MHIILSRTTFVTGKATAQMCSTDLSVSRRSPTTAAACATYRSCPQARIRCHIAPAEVDRQYEGGALTSAGDSGAAAAVRCCHTTARPSAASTYSGCVQHTPLEQLRISVLNSFWV